MEIFNMICSAETGAAYHVQFLFQYLKNNSNIALSHLRHAIHQNISPTLSIAPAPESRHRLTPFISPLRGIGVKHEATNTRTARFFRY